MKVLNTIFLLMLIILSLATGTVKIFKMEEEMALFRAVGFADVLIIMFGLLQIAGGALIAIKKFRKAGAIIMSITFFVATLVVFMNQMTAFGTFSILFILLALYFVKPRKAAF